MRTAIATPVALPYRTRVRVAWPSIVETVLTILAIALVMPSFARVAADDFLRDDRYAGAAIERTAGETADASRTPNAGSHARRLELAPLKDAATRELFATVGWQWAAWMVAGLALVKLARTRLSPMIGLSLACAVWAGAAWAGRVPWPLAQDTSFELARAAAWDARPATFVLALAVASLAFGAVGLATRERPCVRQTLSTRIGYPGFVAATGIGWLVLLDLSANGPPGNRYLALYHQGHLWLAMLVLTALAFLRPAAGRALATLLALVDELGARIARLLGPVLSPALLAAIVLAIVAATGLLLSGIRQVTSELGRGWLVVGVAWFFFLRGAPVADRLARSGSVAGSLVRYAWPLAFVAVVLAGMMIATHDMGPLLIAAYAAGAFLAASVAMWWHLRSGARVAPAILAALLFGAWIVGITVALFSFGALDAVTAGRLENLSAPLASANDQLALVAWFRNAAPPAGFGIGSVPWCGFAPAAACAGVPAQIQSDYTFTALVGMFGWSAAWALTIAAAVWLHRLVRHHGRVTRGEPRFVAHGVRIEADRQAFLSWMGVAWVVLALCQLGVTVAGNLAVLPLTGVTFPFVSFGMTSLVVNCAFLALCLNVDVERGDDA